MYKYDAKSLKAEEFINDEEIQETLAYADANKDNVELIDAIIAKCPPPSRTSRCACAAGCACACSRPSRIYGLQPRARRCYNILCGLHRALQAAGKHFARRSI